jgi:hypothetical protein
MDLTIDELARMRSEWADELKIMATPIDFEQLIKDGLIKRIGKSYYTDSIPNLPEAVAKKIKHISPTKNGEKLTFYKETQKIKKLAEDTKHLRSKRNLT